MSTKNYSQVEQTLLHVRGPLWAWIDLSRLVCLHCLREFGKLAWKKLSAGDFPFYHPTHVTSHVSAANPNQPCVDKCLPLSPCPGDLVEAPNLLLSIVSYAHATHPSGGARVPTPLLQPPFTQHTNPSAIVIDFTYTSASFTAQCRLSLAGWLSAASSTCALHSRLLQQQLLNWVCK